MFAVKAVASHIKDFGQRFYVKIAGGVSQLILMHIRSVVLFVVLLHNLKLHVGFELKALASEPPPRFAVGRVVSVGPEHCVGHRIPSV